MNTPPPGRDRRLSPLHTEGSPRTPAEPDWAALRRTSGDTTYRWRAWAVPDDRPLAFEVVAGPVHYRACGLVSEFDLATRVTSPDDARCVSCVVGVRCNYAVVDDHAGHLATAVVHETGRARTPDDPTASGPSVYSYVVAVTWGYKVVTPAAVEWRCATRLRTHVYQYTIVGVAGGRDPNTVTSPLPGTPNVADFVHRYCPINHGGYYDIGYRAEGPVIPTAVGGALVRADYADVEAVVWSDDPGVVFEAAARIKARAAPGTAADLNAWLDAQVGRALAAYARTIC